MRFPSTIGSSNHILNWWCSGHSRSYLCARRHFLSKYQYVFIDQDRDYKIFIGEFANRAAGLVFCEVRKTELDNCSGKKVNWWYEACVDVWWWCWWRCVCVWGGGGGGGWSGDLPIMAFTRRFRPKGVLFSGFRCVKGHRFHQLKYMKA